MNDTTNATSGDTNGPFTKAMSWPFSARARRSSKQPISYLMEQASHNPNLISLAAGLVDYEILPLARTKQILDEIYQEGEADGAQLKRMLQYGTTEGDPKLRALLLDHLGRLDALDYRSLGFSESNMIVTSGSQQLLFLISDIMLDPGDIVIAESPSYFVYAGTLETLGTKVITVAMDQDGMRDDALETTLAQLEASGEIDRVKLIYTVSYHQNPTGITMAADRKQKIAAILHRYQQKQPFLVVEDAAYRELTYTGQVPASLHAVSHQLGLTELKVATLMTFSKPYAPGFKTGYGLLPHGLMDAIVNLKGNHDFGSANLCQYLLRESILRGQYAAHVKAACTHYNEKLQLMLNALSESFAFAGDEVSWTRPSGGLYVYLTLPGHVDTSTEGAFFKAAMKEGVLYVPGIYGQFGGESSGGVSSEIRLSYGLADNNAIKEGVNRLARAYDSVRQNT